MHLLYSIILMYFIRILHILGSQSHDAIIIMHLDTVSAQRVFFSSTNPTPCFGDSLDLICYYPDVMEMVINGQPRYTATTATYRVNAEVIFPGGNVFDLSIINQTASRLRVRIDPANFTGDTVFFTCFLLLTGGGEDSSSTRLVDPQGSK